MAIIFFIFLGVIISILLQKRIIAMGLIGLGLVATLLIFWHHVTNILQINL